MNLTFGEHRASDQNVGHYMPPLEKSDQPFVMWSYWKLARYFFPFALLMLLICVGLPAAWGG